MSPFVKHIILIDHRHRYNNSVRVKAMNLYYKFDILVMLSVTLWTLSVVCIRKIFYKRDHTPNIIYMYVVKKGICSFICIVYYLFVLPKVSEQHCS